MAARRQETLAQVGSSGTKSPKIFYMNGPISKGILPPVILKSGEGPGDEVALTLFLSFITIFQQYLMILILLGLGAFGKRNDSYCVTL